MTLQTATIASLRWCARVSDDAWKPTAEQYQLLLAQQPPEEQQRIGKFLKMEDSKRSLMGRLLLQSAAALALKMEPSQIKFGRTKGKKPYIHEPAAAKRGLNANVSHHGAWVILGMEEKGLVGVDISSTTPPRPGMQAEAFFKVMETSLTKKEWAAVRSAGDSNEELFHAFFVFWAFKEAYTKAMGIGVALPFRRLELTIPQEILKGHNLKVSSPRRFAEDVKVKANLDGRPKSNWEFEIYTLDEDHLMAVAVGPHDVAVASYKAAMQELLALPTKAGGRRMSAEEIRNTVCDAGNDICVGFDITAMGISSDMGSAEEGSALRLVAAEQLLPQPLAVRYKQAA